MCYTYYIIIVKKEGKHRYIPNIIVKSQRHSQILQPATNAVVTVILLVEIFISVYGNSSLCQLLKSGPL